MFPLVVIGAIGAGCTDAQGNRTGMIQWWQDRSATSAPSPQGERPAHAPEENVADAADPARPTPADRSPAPDHPNPPGSSEDRLPDRVGPARGAVRAGVVVVGDQIINVTDVLDPIRQLLERAARELGPGAYGQRRNEIIRGAIIDAVSERLIWQEARLLINEQIEPQLKKSVDALEKRDINRDFDGRETRYEQYLATIGQTRERVRVAIRRKVVVNQYLRDKLLPMIAAPTKRELRKYYGTHPEEFSRRARRELLLIDIPIRVFLTRADEGIDAKFQEARGKAQAQIEAAEAELAAGEPFEDVARKYSHGIKKDQGGQWGMLSAEACTLNDRWKPAWERLCRLEPGSRSEPFEASKAFFIVKVGRAEGGETTSFEEAQVSIKPRLREQRFARLRATFLQKRFDQSQVRQEELDVFFRDVIDAAPRPPDTIGRAP